MGKPKENTIEKIDQLSQKLLGKEIPHGHKDLVMALKSRCHTMNIHKAKLAYFKRIKLVLTQLLAIAEIQESSSVEEYRILEKEMSGLLNAKNG
jgi:hypothetical protein